jgi:GTP diphosphokinase / guanosine-3',5'-bis(diphosphate) 3'-diphosphatase
MSTLEKAIAIAAQAHAGQTDKGGAPYILHCLRVMMSVDSLDEKIVAVLHDVLEDTDVTASELSSQGFPDLHLEALDSLTKKEGESRIEAAHRAAKNKIARKVKLADNKDNSDISRIDNPTARDAARLEEYARVREILEAKN